MRKFLFLLLSVVLFGCVSKDKRTTMFSSDVSLYDVVCEDLDLEKTFFYHTDVHLKSVGRETFKIEDQTKKSHTLKAAECILERGAKLAEKPEELKSLPLIEASCKIGKLSFNDSRLQVVDQDHSFNYLRRLDGKVWILPKGRCPLEEQVALPGDE